MPPPLRAPAVEPAAPTSAPPTPEQRAAAARFDELVGRARDGEAAAVADAMREAAAALPGERRRQADLVTVLHWAGRDREAAELTAALLADAPSPAQAQGPPGGASLPDYALSAGARAARNARLLPLSLQLYERWVAQAPGDADAQAGRLAVLGEIRGAGSALDALDALSRPAADGPNTRAIALSVVRMNLLRDNGDPYAAMAEAARVLALDPRHREAFVMRARLAVAIGARSVATELMRERPDWFDRDELARLEQDWVAQRVRHGAVARDALDPPQRHTLTDSAISESEWLAESAWAGAFDMTRTLHDRVVALRQRDAFAQATALFETLSGELPDYVLAAAADAYLAQRDPRTALALLDRAIADRRGRVTWDWRLARVNALSDAERHDDARAALEELEFDVRMVQAEASDPMRDEGASAWVDRLNIVKANLERFSHRFDDSVRRLEQAHADTPFDLDVRMAQAGIELDRLQPRRALASARRLQLDHPDSMWPHVAQVEALLDLGDHVGVRDALGRLREQFGESPTLERLERSVTIRRMGVARLSVGPARNQGSPASPNPIGELRVDATVDSPLWADTWRLLAGWQLRSAHLPEGSVYRRRVAAGARIERPELELSAVATGDPEGHDRGAQARAVITLADAWRATLRSARKADDVPLRAHRTGVSLDTDTAELAWHPSERRTLLAEIDTGRFSDGNQRRGGLVAWRERWSDSPARTFETRLSLGTVGFSKQDVAYFAPVRYDSMGLAFTLMQRLHREYDTNWLHRVTLEPTVNRQSGAPTVAGLNLSYEHEWEIRARWGGRAGLSFVRRPYDGVSETRWIGSLELFARY